MKDEYTDLIVSRKALWFGLLGGGAAWMAHLLLVWAIAEFGCVAGLGKSKWLGITVVSWMAIAASVLMLAIGVLAAWIAYRSRERAKSIGSKTESQETAAFMAHTGFITSGIFAIMILVQSVPILFFLREC